MIKGFRQIASLTAISRVFGLVRDICYSHFFGANQLLDAWIIAFRIPNLSRRLFGEGAASASFIPIYSKELHTNPERAAELANTVLTVLFVVLAALVLVGEAGIWFYHLLFCQTTETRLILSLSSVMLPYMLLVCMVAMIAGVLNVHRHFAAPAAAPIVLNLFIITTILATGWLMNINARAQLFCVAVAVLVAGLAQIALQVAALRHCGVSIRPAWQVHAESFKRILLLMGPMVLGLTATQINTLADDLVAWWLSGSEEKGRFFEWFGLTFRYPMSRGSVSHLYYAQRLYQLPLGVLGISLATAVFPVMSADAGKGDLQALRKTISRGIRGAVFVAVPATLGLLIVGRPLVAAAFEHGRFTPQDTGMVVKTLVFYGLGLTAYFAQQILVRSFYALQDSTPPMRSALLAVFANFILNLALVWPLGRAGLACATAICSYLQVGILLVALRKKLGPSILAKLPTTAVGTLLATIAMSLTAISVLAVLANLPSGRFFEILRLVLVVAPAAGVYLLVARLLRMEMLGLLAGRRR